MSDAAQDVDHGFTTIGRHRPAKGDPNSRLHGVQMIPASESPTLKAQRREAELDAGIAKREHERREAEIALVMQKRVEQERIEHEADLRLRAARSS